MQHECYTKKTETLENSVSHHWHWNTRRKGGKDLSQPTWREVIKATNNSFNAQYGHVSVVLR